MHAAQVVFDFCRAAAWPGAFFSIEQVERQRAADARRFRFCFIRFAFAHNFPLYIHYIVLLTRRVAIDATPHEASRHQPLRSSPVASEGGLTSSFGCDIIVYSKIK